MHIPDGFLDAATATTAAVIATAGVALALRRVKATLPARRVPLIGLAAAFVFAAQMLNFPVGAGTSGHLMGGVLAAVLLGPAAAVVVMTAVLILQCFMFADGGITALGANVLNMALIATLCGFGVYRLVLVLTGPGRRSQLIAAGFAAWCSTVIAAVACAIELALSGTVAASVAVPAMGGAHMLIGLGEAAITMLVVSSVARSRPELLAGRATHAGASRRPAYVAAAVLGALALATPLASSLPDGLEHVAGRLGFDARASQWLVTPLPDYSVAFTSIPVVSTLLAASIGTLAAFLLAWLLARALTPGPTDGR